MSLSKQNLILLRIFFCNNIIAGASYGHKPAIVAFKYCVQYVFQVAISYCQCFLWSGWTLVKYRSNSRFMAIGSSGENQ